MHNDDDDDSSYLPAVILGKTSPPKCGETYSDLELFGGELEGDMLIGVHLCLFVGLHIGGSKSSDRFNVAQAMIPRRCTNDSKKPNSYGVTEKKNEWIQRRTTQEIPKVVFVTTKWLLSNYGNGERTSQSHHHWYSHEHENKNDYRAARELFK